MITRFEHFSKTKALEALVWIAWKTPGITQFFVGKILYLADVAYLNKFGCPIVGDEYVAMEHGPVPSFVYDLIKKENISDDIKKTLDESIKSSRVKGTNKIKIKALKEPNLDYFSKNERGFLEQSLEHCNNLTFDELSKETHEHLAWKDAWDKKGTKKTSPMDYELMVKKNHPHFEELIEDIRNNAHFLAFA